MLCQLRMALEKVYPPMDIGVLNKTGRHADSKPGTVIIPRKDAYDNITHKHYKTQLQKLTRAQKTDNMESHLQKFEDERLRQEAQAAQDEKEEELMKTRLKQDIRKANIDKLQRNAGFMEEWLKKGIDDWKKNMMIKREREKKQLEFEYSQTQKFQKFTMTQIQKATDEVENGIDQFEQTLKA